MPPPKIQIVYLAGKLDTGGLEKLLEEFARHVNRDCYELTFKSLTRGGVAAEEIEALGWRVYSLNSTAGLRFSTLKSLRALLCSLKADIVHSHSLRPLIFSRIARLASGFPSLIHTCHGTMFGSSRHASDIFRLATLGCKNVVCVSNDAQAACLRAFSATPLDNIAGIAGVSDVVETFFIGFSDEKRTAS